ncbi:fimbrial protein [Kosakonia sp. H7A]|uniref:fimbrial protein n=1 Tax=Kosakonia sp. H7A TaxID=2054598 RepID=UPI0013048EB3|nr:fimbrial protein [Kosakonia sp. H7A]
MNHCVNPVRRLLLPRQAGCHWLPPLLVCLALSLALSGAARADTCTGWGSDVSKNVDLGLPATVDLPLSATTGTVLASGSTVVPALSCHNDTSGQVITLSEVQWASGTTDAGSGLRYVAPGIGIRLKYHATSGVTAFIPSAYSAGDTQGLDWQSVDWELIRAPGTAATGKTTSGVLVSMVLDGAVRPTWAAPTLNLTVNNAPVVTAACTLVTDKNLVVLPDTGGAEMMNAGHSASRDVQAQITCPADTTLSGGTTLTLSTPQADTDPTLVKNTGTATGVAIEVLDGTTRVSAGGGTVSQAAFTQGSSTASPGATQTLSVRMVRQPGQPVSGGTVQGTFTLTLAVN